MSFETVSLLLSWLELGALLAILVRLGRTFELIAATQRELRRAIHHLGERRAAELGINDVLLGTGITSASGSSRARAGVESTNGPDDLDRLSPAVHPSNTPLSDRAVVARSASPGIGARNLLRSPPGLAHDEIGISPAASRAPAVTIGGGTPV